MLRKKFLLTCVRLSALTLGLSLLNACATSPYSQAPSGFLPDYSLLKQVPTANSNTQLYNYTSPNFNRTNYQAVMVQPVILYQTATDNGISSDQIEAARANIQSGIRQIVSQKTTLSNAPGPGVATLSVAITGAEMQGEGLQPWNLIPVSAAIKLASTATGNNPTRPVLVIELKFTDSVSGQLLRETLSVINAPEFSRQVSSSQEFQALAQTWVQEALQYANRNNPN